MTQKNDGALSSAKLNTETGIMTWEELARHFARGVVICIDGDMDLVTVGQAILNDDAATVAQWQGDGLLRRASDDDARRWHAESTEFWALVVAPWLVVQEREKSVDSEQAH